MVFFSQKYTSCTYYLEQKEEADTELKVDDMTYNFDDPDDEDKLLNPPELAEYYSTTSYFSGYLWCFTAFQNFAIIC